MKRVRMIHTFRATWENKKGERKYTKNPHITEMDKENLVLDGIYFWSHAANSVLY